MEPKEFAEKYKGRKVRIPISGGTTTGVICGASWEGLVDVMLDDHYYGTWRWPHTMENIEFLDEDPKQKISPLPLPG